MIRLATFDMAGTTVDEGHHVYRVLEEAVVREGATLVESVEDILQALRGWQRLTPPAATEADEAHPLLLELRAAPQTSEGLAQACNLPIGEVLAALTELELQGLVACEAGRWVHRVR